MSFIGLNFSKRQLVIIGVAVVVLAALALFLTGIIPGLVQVRQQKFQLSFVGFEDRRVFDQLINGFQEKYPNIEVRYQQIDFDGYENSLVNNLAAAPSGAGPDVFMFRSNWLPKHYDKILPVGEDQFALSNFREIFPTVAEQDFAPDGVVFALPLYIDTLALFYNKDIFDSAGISQPPRNWLEFQDVVSKLRKLDKKGVLTRPAAAIGGSPRNVNKATDILNLLFLQSGIPMVDVLFGRATFAGQGLGVLNFYLSFSDLKNIFYTWNKYQPNSLDIFAQGVLPMMFGYREQVELVKARAPFLNFGVSSVPQPVTSGPDIAYADYYGLAVSGKTANARAAWDFIIYAATDSAATRSYANLTGLPPATRELIRQNANHPDLGVFARQALIARSWPQIDNNAVESIFGSMIELAMDGVLTQNQAIRQAESEITRLMLRKR